MVLLFPDTFKRLKFKRLKLAGWLMLSDIEKLLRPGELNEERVRQVLESVGFLDPLTAHKRLLAVCDDARCTEQLERCLPMLLAALSETPNPDSSLVNFERFVQTVSDREGLFRYLCENPRAVEILIRLFVSSQFLTEILLRNPGYLQRLVQHSRLADIQSREEFRDEAQQWMAEFQSAEERLDALRRYQRWALLRIGACDIFGLMDLRVVTSQLSLLADAMVQACLNEAERELGVSADGFAVVGMGKLGGEELNYSSDIDLVFVCRGNAERYVPLGQRLIAMLSVPTSEGFLYRTDLRLRPWGRSGALVVALPAYVEYVKRHARLWEKQALLKARPVAGDLELGHEFVQSVRPHLFGHPVEEIRRSVSDMKRRIERELARRGRSWGEVKSGEGSIRDIEFVTQFLQLVHGARHPHVLSFNTLDGLVRLADLGVLQADEYRQLSTAYVFLRTIEHSLQLMHNKQTHSLPDDGRELAYLSRRLDFPSVERFLSHYEQHCVEVRRIYEKYIEQAEPVEPHRSEQTPAPTVEGMEPSYAETFSPEEIARHRALLDRLGPDNVAEIEAERLDDDTWRLTVVGYDQLGDLSLICGLLFVYGFDIVDGNVFTAERPEVERPLKPRSRVLRRPRAKFVDVFTVRSVAGEAQPDTWQQYRSDLQELMRLAQESRLHEAQTRLASRAPAALKRLPDLPDTLYPVEITIDNDASPRYTVLRIRAEDTPGFLYELTNAMAVSGVNIVRVAVGSSGHQVADVLWVTDEKGNKITDPQRQQELRAAVVLIKHFTHLLPHCPNPESALTQFRGFVEQLFRQPNWPQQFASLEQQDVLEALARLLGVSSFLWEDFLRLQYENLLPVLTDTQSLRERKSREQLEAELAERLASASSAEERRRRLNEFKDREMFRVDMRHIVGHIPQFGQFSEELTDIAEVTVRAAVELCLQELQQRYGRPVGQQGEPVRLCVAALGKCGGREMGFASDIELMFVYDRPGETTGPNVITAAEFFTRLVEAFLQTIVTRREGVFQIDLRLRPYGRAGSLAVALDAFRNYFAPDGPAWPYERQALVKLRPIAGGEQFGQQLVAERDRLVYRGQPFDVAPMRAMREKQVRQLVKPGTFNAKLSPGGLVDCEYLVQGLQITHGHRSSDLRTTNTLQAIDALRRHGVLTEDQARQLRECYIFLRKLIDALRMVRGHAKDLTVPEVGTKGFQFLARRLGYDDQVQRLQEDIEETARQVRELQRLLDA